MRIMLLTLLGILMAPVHSAPDGRALFADHCSACHGEQGGGGVGVPLALPSFLDSVSDTYLHITIREGRPGRVMPAFAALSDAQVDAIIQHMRTWSDNPAPTDDRTPVNGDPARGKALYASHCAACHGAEGEGGKGTGVSFSRKRSLPITAPALNNHGFLAAASDRMIRDTLRHGREGTPMRSFLEQGLDEKQIDDLVSYVRSFEAQQAEVAVIPDPREEATISMSSSYSLRETVDNLKNAIISSNYILIREDTLEHGLIEEGQDDPSEVILHFCNFSFLYEALKIDPRIGMFLPCRVTVTETDGEVTVTTINPVYLSRLFNNDELHGYCEEMRDQYTAILEDATL